MALFVLAQLASMRTKKDMPGRATAKLEVIQLLQVAKKAPLAEIEAAIASPAE